MARVLPPPVLLLLLLGLGPGPTLAGNCNLTNTTQVEKGENRTISTEVSSKPGQLEGELLFVMPGSGFEGVRLDVQGSGGTLHAAWFPADEKCFQRVDKWLQFQAYMKTDGSRVGLRAGACHVACNLNPAPREPGSLTVVAYGHSDWSKESQSSIDCAILFKSSNENEDLPICQNPPTNTNNNRTSGTCFTPKLPRTTIIAIALTAAGLVVMVAVVVVTAVFFKRM